MCLTVGVYFAWKNLNMEIYTGDSVKFKWTTPDFVNNVTHKVYEVESLDTTDPKAGGIDSGLKSRNGVLCFP